jgi:hypothetical protein
LSGEEEFVGETRLPMVREIMQWALITVLLLVVTWRPSVNDQILLHFLVSAGAVMVVLASFSIKHRVETDYAVVNRSDVGKQMTVRL